MQRYHTGDYSGWLRMTNPPNRVPSDHDRMTNGKSKAFSITSQSSLLIHGSKSEREVAERLSVTPGVLPNKCCREVSASTVNKVASH